MEQMDKATLGEAAFLGILEDTNLTDATYNNLNTIFYTGSSPFGKKDKAARP